MTVEELTAQTRAERERLAHLLAELRPEQWSAPSLCQGWRVREVVAHLTMPYRTPRRQVLAGLVRARFDFNSYADRAAKADTAALSDADLLQSLQQNVNHPWHPPGGGAAGALSHDVIHGLDITEPLGLPPCPPERIALVLKHTTIKRAQYFGVDLRGRQFIATDTEVSLGAGTPIRLPARDILLITTGRKAR